MIHNRNRFEQWLPANFDGEFDWDFLRHAFAGTKIMPMDFDAVIERSGHFLVLETKNNGKQIDVGQSITLTNAWRDKNFSIIHVCGKTPKEITGFAIYSEWDDDKTGNVGSRKITEGNYVDLTYAVRRWFCRANGVDCENKGDFENTIWLSDYDKDIR